MSRWWYTKLVLILLLGLSAFVVVWPSLETMTGLRIPSMWPHLLAWTKEHNKSKISRGLDLRGGLRLVYTVQVDEAIADKRNRFADDMRQRLAIDWGLHTGDKEKPLSPDEQKALAERLIVERPEYNRIVLKFTNFDDKKHVQDSAFRDAFPDLRGPYDVDKEPNSASFKVSQEIETSLRERAVDQAKKTVENRVDELGLKEASITSRDEDIIIEVPGEDDSQFEEIKNTISQTARLEFKILDDKADFFGKLDTTAHPLPTGAKMMNESAPVGVGGDGQASYAPSHYVRLVSQPSDNCTKPGMCKGLMDRAREWVRTIGVPDDHQIGWGQDIDPSTHQPEMGVVRSYYMQRRADVTGEYITDASVSADSQKGPQPEYYVAITFSPQGADRFETITGENIKKRFAILLDDYVDSAPVIQSKIGGGHASITLGSNNDRQQQLQAAKNLEMVLRAGALPAPIERSNEQRIGASLGSDAIKEGLKGALAGAGLVLVFMVFYYRKAGLIADGAVLFNLLLQLAMLALFGASMTLPGIAGLALTIGMAVDANVLINERIREELREGKSPRAAVDAGYSKAFSAVFDGHVTTFIGGLLLLQYGTGPIKGFAVTLIIGIVASLFTAVVCTRLVFDWWVLGAKTKKLSLGQMPHDEPAPQASPAE